MSSYKELKDQQEALRKQLADLQAQTSSMMEARNAEVTKGLDTVLAAVKVAIEAVTWPDDDVYPIRLTISPDGVTAAIGGGHTASVRRSGHRVLYKGVEFPSARALADSLGLTSHLTGSFSAVRLLRDKKIDFA